KGLQKQFFKQNDIPTSAFQFISNKEGLANCQIALPYIQKLRKDGYDGKGVKKISTQADFETAFDAPSIVEELVPFEKEIAVMVARNDKGEMMTFPMVEMEFNPQVNLVEFLISPSTYSFDIQMKAESIAMKIANDLQIVGVLAVEMFLTADRSEEHTSELQSRENLVCRLLLEQKRIASPP